ncbi:energy transducer TonB [Leeuwenhoekiella sp. W20_SRS_FM14]|uniref:energy transducer TonB n=1 Tax=Leeuwenhoekiella sp. W20_SRS_FM14 TaxID=3240270 RepID=UPI003F943233
MKESQKREVTARQSGNRATSKHDVNLRKNSVVYFQIGLIVTLILAILILEIKSPAVSYSTEPLKEVATVSLEDWNQSFVKESQQKPLPKLPEVSKILPPEVVDDNTPEAAIMPDFKTIDISKESINPNDLRPEVEKEVETFSVMGVEVVPIYPGCEGLDSNAARKACLQEKLNSFIGKNFDTSLGEQYGLSGMNKVDVQFTIDEFGNVVNLQSRAPHKALEAEAKRVMNKLPKMKPGTQQGKKVRVIYYQPIKFKVQN